MKKQCYQMQYVCCSFFQILFFIACNSPISKEQPILQGNVHAIQNINDRDACLLLPVAEIEAMVDRPVVTKNMGYIDAEQWGACAYFDKDEQDEQFAVPLLELHVNWADGKDKVEQALKEGGNNLQSLEGIGDGAWFSTDVGQHALLLKGDVLVSLYMSGFPNTADYMLTENSDALKKQFESLAKSIASRL